MPSRRQVWEKALPSSQGGTWPQGPSRAGQEASCACTTLGLGNSPLLAAQGLNTTRQLTIKHKEQTRQQPVWIKEINAYKNALSPWKKGDAKHEASFPRLRSPSDGSEPHNGDGGGVGGQGPPLRASCKEGGWTSTPGLKGTVLPTSCRPQGRGRSDLALCVWPRQPQGSSQHG